ncbi:MAG: hypothetical protein U0R49_11715 [Fimbriimonadales bacterium]
MAQLGKADTFFAYLQAYQTQSHSHLCVGHQQGLAILQQGVEFSIECVEDLFRAIEEFIEGASYTRWHTVLGIHVLVVLSSRRLASAERAASTTSFLPGRIYVDRVTQEHLRVCGLQLKACANEKCDGPPGFVHYEVSASDSHDVESDSPAQLRAPEIRWLTPFFGRTQEIRSVKRLLRRFDHVTVTGAKGIGKSRLCHVIGMRERKERRVETVHLDQAELEGLVPRDTIIGRVLRRAPARFPHVDEAHPPLVIIDADRGRVEDCAELIQALQSSNPAPKILCASRTPTGLPAETVVELGGLEIPASELSSLAKLSERDLLSQLSELSGMRLYFDRLERIGGSKALDKQSMLESARSVAKSLGNPSTIEREALRAAAAYLLSDASDAKGSSAALQKARCLMASQSPQAESGKLFEAHQSAFIKEQLTLANRFHRMLDGEHLSDGMAAFDDQYLTVFSGWVLAAIASRPEAFEFSALLAPYIQRRRPLPEARELLAVTLEIASRVDSSSEAGAALAAAGILTTAGESSNAQALSVYSARLAASAGNALTLAMAEANLALHHKRGGKMYLAALCSLVSATWMHGQQDFRRAAGCMNNLGAILDEMGCLDSAKTLYELAAKLAHTSFDKWTEAWTRINLAEIALRQNRIADSLREFSTLAQRASELVDHRMLATSVEGFSLAAAREQGLESTAIVCAGWAYQFRIRLELPCTPKREAELSKMIAAIRLQLGPAVAESLFKMGERLTEANLLSNLVKQATKAAPI